MAYLKGRQLGDDTIKAFGLGYSSKFSNDAVPVPEVQRLCGRYARKVRSDHDG